MKGLLLKDLYVLTRQMRLFMGAILILCVVNEQLATFGIMYAAMLPYTALAYDEHCRWHQLAAMMPCRPREIVLSKYLIGWLLMSCFAAFSLVMNAILGRLGSDLHISAIISALSLACICLAILLPVMFRFGVEKGRMSMILFFVVVFTFIGSSSEFNVTALPVMKALPALLAAAAVVINAVSIPLATRLYTKRDA